MRFFIPANSYRRAELARIEIGRNVPIRTEEKFRSDRSKASGQIGTKLPTKRSGKESVKESVKEAPTEATLH